MPCSTMAHLAVVPPMSNEISRSRPSTPASAAQPTAPAAGPDSIVCTGLARAASTENAPPLDCVISSRPRKPRSPSRVPNAPR
jgi:hypothetical protein